MDFWNWKVVRLEQRLESLQNAQSLKCSECRPNRRRVDDLQKRLDQLLSERRSHLHELFDMKYLSFLLPAPMGSNALGLGSEMPGSSSETPSS